MVTHIFSTQGKRDYQEDSLYIRIDSNDKKKSIETETFEKINIDIFGVFDGHGGADVSKTISKMLPEYFYKRNILEDNTPKPNNKFNKFIVSTFDDIQNKLNVKYKESTSQGSTVCMCFIYDFKGRKCITSCWVGDSRAIACNNYLMAESLTLDHKPDGILEKKRIESLGGTVTFEKHDVPRINGIIAVSRSLGDFDQKKYIEHKPDITHFICNFKFIVVATDGLWDVMSNQMVCDFVLNCIIEKPKVLTSNQQTKSEFNIAYRLTQKAMELNSQDNITVIVHILEDNIDNYNKYITKFSISD